MVIVYTLGGALLGLTVALPLIFKGIAALIS